ncbi:hypothetical protein C8R43DRAFT_1031571 [Mycena crocata]|nr:hypothetical protein C8R43DRAFT_1031571 [Mycena crocata]
MLTMEDDALISSTLPLDLERHIFRLLAVARPVEIPRLMRVAWRVKHRVEPLLYRTLIINRKPIDDFPSCDFDTLRRIIRTKSATFLHESVRNLMLHKPTVKDVADILPLLSGVENLRITSWNTVFADNSSTPPGFDVLPLRHLYCSAWRIFDFHTIRRLYHLCFAKITHLALFDDTLNPVEFTLCADFADLPHLTHLAFHINVAPMFSICLQLLKMCKRLRVRIRVLRAMEVDEGSVV